MGFNSTFANSDNSLVLTVDARDDGSFNGQFAYNGTSHPIFSGGWHNGVSEASTFMFLAGSGIPDQMALGAAGVIFGARRDKQPYKITIAGAAATITGNGMDAPNALTPFAGELNRRKK